MKLMEYNTNKRITWIDLAKGIGILLVMMGHMPSLSYEFRMWIFSFHMPLFFSLSGYTSAYKLKPVSLKKLIINKTQKLLIPYYVFSLLFIVVDFVILKISKEEIEIRLTKTLAGQGGYDILWFLWAMFWAEILYRIIWYLFCKYKYLVAIFFVFIGLVLSLIGFTYLKIPTILIAMGFYTFGFLIFDLSKNIQLKGLQLFCILLGSFIANIIVVLLSVKSCGKTLDMNNCFYPLGPISIIGAICGCIVICYIVIHADKVVKNGCIHYIGRNSLFFFTIGTYLPNLIVDAFEVKYEIANPIIKILSKLFGFGVAFCVSMYIEHRRKRSKE